MSRSFRSTNGPQADIQRLNEHAAFCIEIGCYDRAQKALGEAQQIVRDDLASQIIENTNQEEFCSCCSLDSCIAYSQIQSKNNNTTNHNASATPQQNEQQGFVYARPIRVPSHALKKQDHNGSDDGMSLVLSWVATYNLALVHHLKAVQLQQQEQEEELMQGHLRKALTFYEMVASSRGNPNCASILRFNVILLNNLGEVYRLLEKAEGDDGNGNKKNNNNSDKYQLCRSHLLSAMMMMVESEHEMIACHMLSESELDGLVLNATRNLLVKQCAAAA